MLLKLENPSHLSKVIDIISELVTEVRIKVNEFGMTITAIDPANVSMLGFKIPRTAFSQFETGTDTLGVSLDNFKKILKRCGSKSSLILEKVDNTLVIKIQDSIKRTFSLNLIEIESEDIDFEEKVSKMDFSADIELNSGDFIDSIEDCAVVADACSFIVSGGKFIIEAKELNSAKTEFSGDEAKIIAEDCRSRYSLEYLSKFAKGAKICDKTVLRFSNDHPLRIKFRIDSMELSFILAPRMEIED